MHIAYNNTMMKKRRSIKKINEIPSILLKDSLNR